MWAQFLGLLEADANDRAAVAPLFRAFLVGGDLPVWQQVQAALGVTADAARGLGIYEEPGSIPLDEITVDPLGVSSADEEAVEP